MVDMSHRDRLDLFLSTKVDNMLEKNITQYKIMIIPFFACFQLESLINKIKQVNRAEHAYLCYRRPHQHTEYTAMSLGTVIYTKLRWAYNYVSLPW